MTRDDTRPDALPLPSERHGRLKFAAEETSALRVVILEDNPVDAELMARQLDSMGYRMDFTCVTDEPSFCGALDIRPDLILADYSLPGMNAIRALTLVRERGLEIPFIVVTGTLNDAEGAECIKLGATDYLLKDRLARLPRAVEHVHEQKRLRMRHAQAMQMFHDLAGSIHEVFYLRSADLGEILYVTPSYEEVWGRTCESVYADRRSWMDSIHSEDLPATRQVVDRSPQPGGCVFEYRIVRPDGSVRYIRDRNYPVYDEAGNVQRVTGIAEDITDRKEAEQKIQRLNRMYAVLSGINAAIARLPDRKELLDEACRIAVEHGGFGLAWIGLLDSSDTVVLPAAWAGFGDELKRDETSIAETSEYGHGTLGRAIRGGVPVFSNDIAAERGMSGRRRRESLRLGYRSLITLPLHAGNRVAGNLTLYAKEANFFNDEELKLLSDLAGDISFALDRLEKEERLNYLAYYDALTGLPNRTLFHDHLSRELLAAGQRGTRVAVLVGDIQRFRFINESLGRHVGDSLLKEICKRAQELWPEPANLGRISSNVFAAIVPDARSVEEIEQTMTGFISALSAPFTLSGKSLSVGFTTAAAIFPADGADAEILLGNAEAALKKAKASGDAYLFYEPAMNAAVSETLMLENRMKRALESREFVLHYQPKVDVATGQMSGVEALIRWNDPGSGLVAPSRFIPLLEETGLIIGVGQWAMRQALEDHLAFHWDSAGLSRISVNVSSVQLRQKDFVDVVKAAIAESGSAASCLELEITESVIMEELEGTIHKLRELRAMGVEIAIDDFGTGYSSLAYLAKLPVNTLKIDRSFIVQMDHDPDSMTIAATIISLGRSLRLKVVAEGIESEDQFKLLKLLKCDEAQGYLFSKPVPAAELKAGPGNRMN